MLNPKIISAITDISELAENRKGNDHITDDEFREMIYAKAKQIVDYVEIENMEKDPKFIAERKAEEEAEELKHKGNSGSEQRDWAEEHGEL